MCLSHPDNLGASLRKVDDVVVKATDNDIVVLLQMVVVVGDGATQLDACPLWILCHLDMLLSCCRCVALMDRVRTKEMISLKVWMCG
jgi:hypothetical protein